MEKLSIKNKKYEEYLKFLKNNPQSQNPQQIEQAEDQIITNMENNINNEESNPENNSDEPRIDEEPISEDKFKFLKEKFESKPYDRNYIVKCLQKDLVDYQKYIEEEIEKREKK